jgi:hypothetical protein
MNLHGWLPARIVWRDSVPRVEWTLLGSRRLLDPFFELTLGRQMSHPFHQLFRRDSSLEEMIEWTDEHPGAPLRGMIFHMSRCGSTLMSQQLAACEYNVVASEPAPFEALVRAHLRLKDLPREVQIRWIRAMVSAIGQARAGEAAFYLKTDCWLVHQMDLIREAFPDVPWVFLYRDPVEVMVSHKRIPAAWTVPGLLPPQALKLRTSDWDPTQTDVYVARAVALICGGGLEAVQNDENGILVNYSELPNVMYERMLPHFRLPRDAIPAMKRRSLQNARSPNSSFSRDEKSKQGDATDRLRDVVADHLEPIYRRLEAARQAQAKRPLSGSLIPSHPSIEAAHGR